MAAAAWEVSLTPCPEGFQFSSRSRRRQSRACSTNRPSPPLRVLSDLSPLSSTGLTAVTHCHTRPKLLFQLEC